MVSNRLSASGDIQAAPGHAIDQHALLKYSPLRELDVAERPGQGLAQVPSPRSISNQPVWTSGTLCSMQDQTERIFCFLCFPAHRNELRFPGLAL
jgi:hypothetical protein